MEIATSYIAILVSVFSLVISLGVAIANYNKSKRDAFIKRRDVLLQTISELNARNNEVHLILARYEIVAVKKAGLPLSGEQAERNRSQIASLNKTREGIEKGMKSWDENVEQLHILYSNLTLEKDAAQVERYIALVQAASDGLKKANAGYLSSLHILENTNQLTEAKLAEAEEKIKQINLAFDEKIKQINLAFERRMKTLGN